MKYKAQYICRVCGYEDYEPFWLETGGPSWQICLCCGTESGYDDCNQFSIDKRRKDWIEGGYKWFDTKEKPKDWNPEEQMKNVSKEYL